MWGYALKDGEAPTNPSRSKKLRHVVGAQPGQKTR